MKIGLLGGSFDPPHWGHLRMAQKSMQTHALDKVIFIPCLRSPHKADQDSVDPEKRLSIMKQLTRLSERWECSDVEIKRDSLSYTVDTVRFFKESYPEDQLFWIMGDDQWQVFETWKDYREIVSLVELIVCSRKGFERTDKNDVVFEGRLYWVDDVKEDDLSSRDMRAALKKGQSVEGKLPEQVMRWIKENQLYGYRPTSK